MPEIGDVTSLFPGHKAVFKGQYFLEIPVYETIIPELMPDDTQFHALLVQLPQDDKRIHWLEEDK